MEELLKKIQELRDLVKKINPAKHAQKGPSMPAIPEIKHPAMPSMKPSQPTKMPGTNPGTHKDPKKVAQQLKNAQVQKQKMPLLKFEKNGQWSLN